MEETWLKDAYKKSKTTVYLEVLQELFEQQKQTNQYKVVAQVLDALNDTSNANAFTDLESSKLTLQQFKCANLKEYIAMYGTEIDPRFCTVGDVVVVLDDPYDDIAFNVGSHFMFVHDEEESIKVARIGFEDIPKAAVAFRLT